MSPSQIRPWVDGLGGRRFCMTMGAGVVNTALFVAGILSESGYVTLTLATVAVYIGASTTQRIKENGSARAD